MPAVKKRADTGQGGKEGKTGLPKGQGRDRATGGRELLRNVPKLRKVKKGRGG
jgi:hypothetical protein